MSIYYPSETLGFVNVIDDYGAVGNGTTDDTAAIQNAINSGRNVYIPGGYSYRLDDVLEIFNASGQTIFGDGSDSRIVQHDELKNCFYIRYSNDITIKGLHGIGNRISEGYTAASGTSADRCFIFTRQSYNITIEDNFAEGFLGRVINMRGVHNFKILNNFIWNNVTEAGYGGDITVANNFDVGGDESNYSTNGVISGNHCLSNNDIGIDAGNTPTSHITVDGNVVHTLDANLDPVDTGSLIRRHSILLSYTTNDALYATDTNVGELISSNNICRNTKWTGMYINGSAATVPGEGNKVVITGNICSQNGLNVLGGDAALQGGIQCVHAKDIVIANNIVRLAGSGTTDTVEGIQVYMKVSGSNAVVEGNVIEDITGTGLQIWGTAENTVVSNNIIRNCRKRCLEAYGATLPFGRYIISGNNMTSYVDDLSLIVLNTAVSVDEQDIIFSNNFIQRMVAATANHQILSIIELDHCTITGNTFAGPDGDTTSFGIRFSTDPAASTIDRLIISNNRFKNLAQGIVHSSLNGAEGPIVCNNNAFYNVTTKYNGVYAGTIFGDNVQFYSLAPPSGIGTWAVGDVCWNSGPSSGEAIYWVCISGGGPTTAWQPVGTIS